MMQKLNELCKVEDIASDGGFGWVLSKRYQELDALVSANRSEYLRSGGVGATIALMLSRPNDAALQAFSLGLLAKSKPSIAHIGLAWNPIVHAVKTFPGDVAIQENGTCLLLRGALSAELEDEALKEIHTLTAAAKTLFEGAEAEGTTTGNKENSSLPPGSSLCGEVLAALQVSEGRPAALVELWYTTLSLTSHFVAAKDVATILAQLRKVLSDRRIDRTILLSCLATMWKMYSAAQLHFYEEDLLQLLDVLADYSGDVEVQRHVLKVFAAIAHSPSIPNRMGEMLRRMHATVSEGEDQVDLLPAALAVLDEHLHHAPANLVTNPAAIHSVLTTAFTSEDPQTITQAMDTTDTLLFAGKYHDIQQFDPASLFTAVAAVPMVSYHAVLPVMKQWGGLSLGDETCDVCIKSLMVYLADEAKRVSAGGVDGRNAEAAAEVLLAWGARMRENMYLPLLLLCDTLITKTPGKYDRTMAEIVLSHVHDMDQMVASHVLSFFAKVLTLEATYWFPARALRARIKQKILDAVPKVQALTYNLPSTFIDFVYSE